MKKILCILIIGFTFTTTLYADKIEYYSATTGLVEEIGVDGTAEKTALYSVGIAVTAVLETAVSPLVLFFNLFQDEKVEETHTPEK